MAKTNWFTLISEELKVQEESWEDVVQTTLTEETIQVMFDSEYGGTEGCAFTLWTANRVYFPVCYDGAEWVNSVPRNPCEEASNHCGGG